MNKKGYAYFIEIILAVIIVAIIFQGFIESDQDVSAYKQQEDMRITARNVLKGLDELGILNTKLNTNDYEDIETYIQESLGTGTSFDWELYNESGCYPIDQGVLGSPSTICDRFNSTGNLDSVSTYYTVPYDNSSGADTFRTFKIYIWRKLS